YRAPANIGLERLVTMCLAGPAAERYFVGPITDGDGCATPLKSWYEPNGRNTAFVRSPPRCCDMGRSPGTK
ncbi:MAG: hypothetical protein WB689_37980, partial [Xanthobacteraceae bacterium]